MANITVDPVTLLSTPGICRAITSTGDGLQQYKKVVGSSDGTTTKPISADVLQLGRGSLLRQLNKQRFALNDSHIVQATATGLLVINATTGKVEQSLSIDPSSCTPLELAEANGLNAGSNDKPIVLLVLCETRRVYAMAEIEGRLVVEPYKTRDIQSNLVSIRMSTTSDSSSDEEATGLAFLKNDIIYHLPYLSGSPIPVLFYVSSSRSCQEPALSSLNTTHYLLVCTTKFFTVDKKAKTTLIGSRVQGSKISSSENGEVVVLSTGTNAEVRTVYLTQSCSIDVAGLVTVDFTKVKNSTFVLLFTSQGVYLHNVSTGCPSSIPSLLTMTPVAPVCLEQQACFGYYFTEDINLLFVTSQKSTNPDRYEVEAYDMTLKTSLNINFVLHEPPLLLHYEPLPPLPPLPTPSSSDTITITSTPVSSSSPVATPPGPNIESNTQIIVIGGVFGLVLLGCITIAGIIISLVICKHLHRKRPQRELPPARKCLSSESIESSESSDSIKTPQIHPPIQASLDTPVQENHETSVRLEHGPSQPQQFV